MLSLGAASHFQEVRGQAKEFVALVEYKVLGYELGLVSTSLPPQ
jgi:hypothetical protein